MLYSLFTSFFALSVFFSSPVVLLWKQTAFPKPLVLGTELAEEKSFAPIPRRIHYESLGMELSARSAFVLDRASNYILYDYFGDSSFTLASITKLMTALVVLESQPEWEKLITIRSDDLREGNIISIFTGEQVSIKTLFNLMLIASSNEAAVSLSRDFFPSQKDFVIRMNQKASELGMKNTIFVEPTGLDSGNISTARDFTIVASEAFAHSEIAKVTQMSKYTFTIANTKKTRTVHNTHSLLEGFLNDKSLGYEIIGVKTGFLNEVGYNITTEISYQGHPVLITLVGSKSALEREQDVKSVADWVFRNYEWR